MKYTANEFQVITGLKLEIELDREDVARLIQGQSIYTDKWMGEKVNFIIKMSSE